MCSSDLLISQIPELKKNVQGILLENESMSKHTSYGIGGKVMAYITPHDVKDLIEIIKIINEKNLKFYFVGSGSNLLVNDKKINAIIITPAKALKSLTIKKNTINAESGVIVRLFYTHRGVRLIRSPPRE